ncbi:uncharacterized protein LOC100017222 isoform X4 [Monodelphis domestica]|uniref:uncharacterized protein LOC100017222 isoform X4 n=1 Tax=Monodelphis domestica TaxID=13616 RepID=UPI0024E1D707|nr:uncharacterized protein LOC100017222 isoform X4 [Monodelphis domestica]
MAVLLTPYILAPQEPVSLLRVKVEGVPGLQEVTLGRNKPDPEPSEQHFRAGLRDPCERSEPSFSSAPEEMDPWVKVAQQPEHDLPFQESALHQEGITEEERPSRTGSLIFP